MALVSQAAFGHVWSSPKKTVDAIDFGLQKDRLIKIYRADTSNFHDSRVAGIWSDIRSYASQGLIILNRIDQLDSAEPSGWQVLDSLRQDSKSDAWWRAVGTEVDKNTLRSQFREVETSLNQSIGQLAATVGDLSLPDAGVVKITYYPAWHGAFSAESLELLNISEQDFGEALIFVTMRDKSGATLTHLHYADGWARGTTLTAQYRYGQSDYVNSQVPENPTSVEIIAVTGSGVVRSSYELSQQEWDARIRGYLQRVTFDGVYLGPYREESTGREVGPGFKFSFQGLQHLPVRAANIRLFSAGSPEDFSWKLESIDAGGPYSARTTSTSQANTAELILWFEDTNDTVTIPSGAPAKISAK